MAARVRFLAAPLLMGALMGALSACAPSLGPPPPGRFAPLPPPVLDDGAFRAADFAWSQVPGKNTLSGTLARPAGPVRYTCAGLTVVATPETPWSRRRMTVLYRSDQRASLPADDVRSRQNLAAPGDSDPYVRRAKCDAADHFVFPDLPDGPWYLVTLAKPMAPATGPNLAIMRRVVAKGGKVTAFDL